MALLGLVAIRMTTNPWHQPAAPRRRWRAVLGVAAYLLSLGMARVLTIKQSLLLVVGGVVAAELWVALFGLWAIFDTPLLKLGVGAGLGVSAAAYISMCLFALGSATMFTLPLLLFF